MSSVAPFDQAGAPELAPGRGPRPRPRLSLLNPLPDGKAPGLGFPGGYSTRPALPSWPRVEAGPRSAVIALAPGRVVPIAPVLAVISLF